MDAEEIQYDNDCLVITIDIVDCPMAEIPLTEVFNVLTMSLLDNYHEVIRNSVLHRKVAGFTCNIFSTVYHFFWGPVRPVKI